MLISEIWRYPVKSMGGERLDQAVVTDLGIEFDRGWGVFDPATSLVLTGRREPKLLMAAASVTDGELTITLPGGDQLAGELPAMSEVLSSWLGHDVELRRAGSTGGTYETPIDVETEQEWAAWTGPSGAWHDSARTRLSILSAASTDRVDPVRFRANLVTDGDAQQEDDWVDAEVQIGSPENGVGLSVVKRIERCVMVGRPQAGLDADIDAVRWVIRERDNLMGVGALVTRPGRCAVGDEIKVVS